MWASDKLCHPFTSQPPLLDSSLRWNDNENPNEVCRHSDSHFAMPHKFLTSTLAVIYGQEVLYAARGQEARSRPAQAGIQWFKQSISAERE